MKNWKEKDKNQLRQWLADMMRDQMVVVTFEKRDGTQRVMKCTLQENVVVPYETKTDRKKEKNDDVLAVWDLEASAWRSFKLDSIREIQFTL
jgi:hypothetical protein